MKSLAHRVVHASTPAPARRLMQFVANLTGWKPNRARRHIAEGTVAVNHEVERRPEMTLRPGDVVHVFPAEKRIRLAKPKTAAMPRKLKVWYEDNHLIVVDKPAGLLSMPARNATRLTLLEAVRQHLGVGDSTRKVFCLQRLDRDVSGIVVFAKDNETYLHLRKQFEEQKPERKYVAIISGHPSAETGTFRSYLATGRHLKRFSVKNPKQGELAITHYKVIRRLAKESVVEVSLETGRRNQIRVHFSESGHPVIGETRYSRLRAARDAWDGRRIALHANTLSFVHPVTGQKMSFCSPWPPEFKAFVRERTPKHGGAHPAEPPQSEKKSTAREEPKPKRHKKKTNRKRP